MGAYDLTLGTLLVGIWFNTYLYGIVTYQSAAYWRTPFNDHLLIKAMVLFLFVLDTVHSAAVLEMAWYYCVTNYANPEALGVAHWPYTFTPIATALAAFVTQAFLGYRVFRLLHNNKYIYGFLLTCAFISMVLGIYCGSKAWSIAVLAELSVLTPPVTAWLSLQASLDLILCGLLVYCFLGSRTGFRRTDDVLNQLIRGAIQTGVFAAMFALADLATFIQYPTANFYGMFAIPIGRIYTNTLLDTLLTRETLRNKFSSDDHQSSPTAAAPRSELRWGHSHSGEETTADYQLDNRDATATTLDVGVKSVGLDPTGSIGSDRDHGHDDRKAPSMA
ncbi:unnamed protein product [Peniophora sp. CBMAI 1063]|nr:unnamed protein product [Peniophora sp. CBMAI 1063]